MLAQNHFQKEVLLNASWIFKLVNLNDKFRKHLLAFAHSVRPIRHLSLLTKKMRLCERPVPADHNEWFQKFRIETL